MAWVRGSEHTSPLTPSLYGIHSGVQNVGLIANLSATVQR
ncbi:MAG: hypothetical protein JWM95_552 [Gemmatimonadetes bacterium]|nr:hypothetical protein [Gemmatimonadota bacterium]